MYAKIYDYCPTVPFQQQGGPKTAFSKMRGLSLQITIGMMTLAKQRNKVKKCNGLSQNPAGLDFQLKLQGNTFEV